MTRAEFRALRETLGITQQALADELGVQVRSVRRWESSHPKGYYEPPQDAWDVLRRYADQQQRVVAYALEKVEEIADEMGAPDTVEIKYWLSEPDYISWSTDVDNGIIGDWRMANANARATALILQDRGYTVAFVNGAGNVVSGAPELTIED